MPRQASGRWRRVTSRNRCPICNRASWCLVSPDGAIAACMRSEDGSFRVSDSRLGPAFLHRLSDDFPPSSLRIPPSSSAETSTASVDRRHAVYAGVLESLTLSQAHAAYLRNEKKLSEETVTRNLYATVPADDAMSTPCAQLAAEHDLTGVPGFWRARDGWRCEARSGELLIPVRDRQERIVAIQRRTGGTPKYRFMSNADRGASCGTPPHFALPYLAELYPDDPVIITEGPLKADAIAEQLHCVVIGVPGVGSLAGLDPELPALRGRRVRVAFDSDSNSNPHVRAALGRLLLRLLADGGISAGVLLGDEAEGKGLEP